MLRIGTTVGVPEVLRYLGADPVTVLAEVGVDLSLFDNPGNLISFAARGRMIEHCASRTGCPHFGLLVGQKAGLSSFGLVGLLAKYSTDIGDALSSLVRFMHLHVTGATTTLTFDSGLAALEYQIYEAGVVGNDLVGEGAVAVAFNVMRDLCGVDWKPVEVRFAHRRPENQRPYLQFFKAPLYFDAAEYSVVFPASLLKRRLNEGNPELLGLLRTEIGKLEAKVGGGFLLQLRSLLRSAIVTGHSSADEVAQLLSIHRRTLNHRLKEYGTNFRKVADEVRFEIARQLLEDSQMSIFEIALLLGYSNASAFTRAFRGWSQMTPAKWRMLNGGP